MLFHLHEQATTTPTHHVNIIEMKGQSYRLAQSRAGKAKADT